MARGNHATFDHCVKETRICFPRRGKRLEERAHQESHLQGVRCGRSVCITILIFFLTIENPPSKSTTAKRSEVPARHRSTQRIIGLHLPNSDLESLLTTSACLRYLGGIVPYFSTPFPCSDTRAAGPGRLACYL